MIRYTFLTLFCFFGGFIYSQTILVCDENNLQPIEHVMVFSDRKEDFVLSDLNGKVDLKDIKSRKSLFFSHPGYEMYELSYNEVLRKKTIYLVENNVKINEIVISANKWAQKSSEIPSKISSISTKQIDLLAPQTTADLLASGGEVFVQKSQQGGGSPMIRGFATNRLLIAVDGVRMNTAIFRSGNLQNVISLDAFATESTEIFFGPGSVIYGSDAIGGVMSFHTLSPTFSDSSILVKGKTNVRYSSANNEMTGHFDVNVGYTKWAFLSSITYTEYGDLKMGSNGSDDYLRLFYVTRENGNDVVMDNPNPDIQTPSGYDQMNFMQKVAFKPNNNWNLTYGFHYSTTSNFDRYDRLIRTKNDLPKSAEWYYGPQVWMMNNLNIVNTTKSKIYDELTIRMAHQLFKESRHDRDFGATLKNHNYEEVNALSVNFDFHKALSPKHQLFYGIEAVYNGVQSEGEIEDIESDSISKTLSRYPEANWQSYAAYFTYNFEYSENLRLNAGARYNQFLINAVFDTVYQFPFDDAKINNGAFTGNIGFVYNPINEFWLNANFSTGFRSPNIDDMGKIFDSGDGIVVVPNTELGPEYVYNVELGINHIIADVFKYNITAYNTILNNALIRRDFQFNGLDSIEYRGELSKVKAIQNGAKTKIHGIQAGIDIKFPAGIGFDARLNYQKGTEEAEDGSKGPSRHAAPLFGTIHLTYSNQKIRFDLYGIHTFEVSNSNLSVEERDKAYLYAKNSDGLPYAPAWTCINFKGMYQINKNISLTAGVENILDIRYRPYSSGITAAGRSYITALKVLF